MPRASGLTFVNAGMGDEAMDFSARVAAEMRRLAVTREDEASDPLEFAMPATEYLTLLRALPDGAGWSVVKARIEALVPPEFPEGWKTRIPPGDGQV